MANSFRVNPGVEGELKRSLEMKAVMHILGGKLASAAQAIGSGVATSYTADVVDTSDGVQVQANTDGINAAGWVEFGTSKLAAYAPLRRGAESAGLTLQAD